MCNKKIKGGIMLAPRTLGPPASRAPDRKNGATVPIMVPRPRPARLGQAQNLNL